MDQEQGLHVVVGASGGIGSAVCRRLAESGYAVRAVNRSGQLASAFFFPPSASERAIGTVYCRRCLISPAAASTPQSTPEALTVRVITTTMGLVSLPVSVRASSSSTQENMKQKKAATPIPAVMVGTKILIKKRQNG